MQCLQTPINVEANLCSCTKGVFLPRAAATFSHFSNRQNAILGPCAIDMIDILIIAHVLKRQKSYDGH